MHGPSRGLPRAALLAIPAILAASAGCASRDRTTPPRTAIDSQAGAADRFGYQAGRAPLLARLEDAREPSERARLVMELADLAERTRSAALERKAELDRRSDHESRAERDGLGRLARSLRDEEVRLLERVARDHEESPRHDEALYRLAFALLEGDSPAAALQHARALFAEHPQSPYVAHAYLAFADHYFGKKDPVQAIRLYEKVIAIGSPEAAPRAHLQLGRCRAEGGGQEEALGSFVEAANAAEGLGGPTGAALRDEALAELVRAYARVGAPEEALALFGRVGADRIDDLLERLGAAYFDDGRFRESIVVNRQVAKRVECSPAVARVTVAVLEARLYLGEIDDLKAEGEALVEVFGRLSRCLPAGELAEFAEAGAMAKDALRSQAERYRREYEFSGAPAAAQMADELEVMAESF